MSGRWFERKRQAAGEGRALMRGFVGGLPAILVAVGVIVLWAHARSPSHRRQTEQRYAKLLKQAQASERWNDADFALRRLLHINPEDRGRQFTRALIAAEEDQLRKAATMMLRIAPADGDVPGYGPAHCWLARNFHGPGQPGANPQLWRAHLERAADSDPSDAYARRALGRLAQQDGRNDEAITHFEACIDSYPDSYPALIASCRFADRLADAKRYLQRCETLCNNRIQQDPDNADPVWLLGGAHFAAGDYAKAEQLLAGYYWAHQPGDPRIRQSLVRLYLAWFAQLKASEGVSGRSLRVLYEALRVDATNGEVLTAVATLAGQRGQAATQAREFLERQLTAGAAPPLTHLVLGVYLAEAGDDQGAEVHLQAAWKATPEVNLPELANNLAMVMARQGGERSRLERALKLVDFALTKQPENAEMRDTRGRILLRAGSRDLEALSELERALAAFPNRASLHAALSECYRRLGRARLAAEHLRLAGGERFPKTSISANPVAPDAE